MKPIAIIQFVVDDGPAYFTDYLSTKNIRSIIFRMHAGDTVPENMAPFSGLCVLGGPMSANDPLPYMPKVYALLNDALSNDIPIIGHCLGGQMLAKALGAVIKNSPQAEIGWSDITPLNSAEARRWFCTDAIFPMFQWHYESFTLPAGVTLLASTAACPHQAFSMGKHIGMQFHCEVTQEKIDDWLHPAAEREIEESAHLASVQSVHSIRATTLRNLVSSLHIAGHIYEEWLRGVSKD